MRKSLTYQEVYKLINGYGYKLLSKENDIVNKNGFVLQKTKINIWCKNKNHESYYVTLDSFIRGHRCKMCSDNKKKERIKWTEDKIKKYVEQEGYNFIRVIIKNGKHSRIEINCNNHDNYEVDFNNFYKGKRCPYCCNNNIKYTYDDIKKYIESFGYELLSDKYKNVKSKIKIKCPNGHMYEVDFKHFKSSNSRCPYCSAYKNEEKIANTLDRAKVNYKRQYRFDDCIIKQKLPFDFYLPEYNCCIEYDGEQHYKYSRFNMDLLDLMNRKYYDNYKTNYCEKNKIKLIRIPYWEKDNIEQIINTIF